MPLLEIKDLHTFFRTKRGIVKAVNGVSYSVEAGKTLGVVGESGSGKSVSAMSMLHLIDSNGYIASGEILFNGVDLVKLTRQEMYKVRGNEISVIFQEPMTSLNPVFTVERQISEPFMIHQGMSKKQAAKEVVKMLADVKIPNPEVVAKQYPHQLSGGMRQRVMIAMALACKPKLLIADEPTTALDVTIQAQILELLQQLSADMGMSILLITHNFGVVAETCDRISVMYAGKVVETGETRALLNGACHPYSRALIRSIPGEEGRGGRLETIPGSPPALFEPPESCMFAPRCPYADDRCRAAYPGLVDCGGGHLAACFKPLEKGGDRP